ncbi:hypothetical protein [Streptomyces sp. NPDC096012]|uniref:hypothetical protein n=1 Tax=Streptomyces sp. NPDC096012 TaxID=3155684 RepID=UPI00336A0235
MLLLAGGPPDRPAPQAVADALVACGIPLAVLREPPPPDRCSGEGVRYGAETTAGARITVQVLGPEDRNRDLFHRLARIALLRHPDDTGAHSPLPAVEHELLMLVFAGRTGARAARSASPAPTTDHRGGPEQRCPELETFLEAQQKVLEHMLDERALRELLERAAAGHGTRREKVVAARARTAATDGAVWGILYGRQPEAEADEPEDDEVFGDGQGDEEPLTNDGALSAAEPAPPGDSPAGAVQEAGVPAPRRPEVTVYDPFEESLRW